MVETSFLIQKISNAIQRGNATSSFDTLPITNASDELSLISFNSERKKNGDRFFKYVRKRSCSCPGNSVAMFRDSKMWPRCRCSRSWRLTFCRISYDSRSCCYSLYAYRKRCWRFCDICNSGFHISRHNCRLTQTPHEGPKYINKLLVLSMNQLIFVHLIFQQIKWKKKRSRNDQKASWNLSHWIMISVLSFCCLCCIKNNFSVHICNIQVYHVIFISCTLKNISFLYIVNELFVFIFVLIFIKKNMLKQKWFRF